MQSPAYKRHLEKMQNEWDAEKYRESRALDLYNEKTFYRTFVNDLLKAEKEVVIYSPFISKFRSEFFKNTFEKLKRRNIAVFIFTRPLEEHEYLMRNEIKAALGDYEEFGASIIEVPGFIHAKTAIIDRNILWDGSLNILSQRQSQEIMRRTEDKDMAKQVMDYLGLSKQLAEGYKYQYERLYRSLVDRRRFNIKLLIKIKLPKVYIGRIVKRFLSVISRSFVLCLKCVRLMLTLFS